MELSRIGVLEAQRLLDEEGYVLVDIRSMPEFRDGHPEPAYNVPFLHKTPQGMIPNGDFAGTMQATFPDKAHKIMVIGAMGARSVRAAQELLALGYTNVRDVSGGFNGEFDDAGDVVNVGWQAAGLAVADGDTKDRAYQFLPSGKAKEEKTVDDSRVTTLSEDMPEDAEGMNRFASRRRKVNCIKLGRELPGLKRRPYPGPLGERIFNEVSAEAWNEWVEHSKMIINEYRINSSDPASIKLLMEQCEAFVFGEGVERPEGFVPEA